MISKKAIITSLTILFIHNTYSQILINKDSTNKFYKSQGVIFKQDYKINFEVKGLEKRFTPSVQDIQKAESLLLNNYNSIMSSDERILNFQPIKSVKRKFEKYVRQYLGFIDSSNNYIIFIQLLNFNVSHKDKERSFNGWKSYFITGSGTFYESNTSRYLVNLNNYHVKLF
jgi:hypothetical protein